MLRPSGGSGTGTRLAGLDHLRALAITVVVFFHYRMFGHPAWINALGSFGWTGVDLFFVLSGYLIAGQLFSQIYQSGRISLGDFYLKRFFRIIPAYLVVVAVYFSIPAFREVEAPAPLWKFLTFTQNLRLDLRHQRTFSHAWSLCIEEQFYLLLPLLLIVFVRLRWNKYTASWVVAALFVGCIGIRLWVWHLYIRPAIGADDFGFIWYKNMYYPTYTRLDGLLVGIGLAGIRQFYPSAKAWIDKNGNLLLLTGVPLAFGIYFSFPDSYSFSASIFGFSAVAVLFGILLAGTVSPVSILYKSSSKITSRIAALSYGIYLTHKGVCHLTQRALSGTSIDKDGNLMFCICMLTCLAAALVLRYTIEKPFLKLKSHLLKALANRR